MLCDRCGQNEASMHFINVENGVANEVHLCNECAAQTGNMPDAFSLKDWFSSFLPPQQRAQKVCRRCGSSLADIQKSGFAGCQQCYTDLYDEMLPMLSAIHGATEHVGSGPKNRLKEHTQESPQELNEIETLREQLTVAVSDENYEQAAELRDQIKQLETQEG